MILQSATVTRIESVKVTAIPPAVADIRTSDGETFPIFDWLTLEAARDAHKSQALILLHIDEQERHAYIRTITVVDPNVETMSCPWCDELMARSESAEPRSFNCLRCHRRIFLDRVSAVLPNAPMIARARLDVTTDGLFSLDNLHYTATLMDTCVSSAAYERPNNGVRSDLLPAMERAIADDSWRIGCAYQRWMGDNVTLRLSDGRIFDVV
jgi:hypothetical protein